jgi:hypothetical protein
MAGATADEISLRIQVDDEADAKEVEQHLHDVGAADVKREGGGEGILPIVMIVVAVVVGVAALADLIQRIRKQHMCQEILDCRGKDVHVKKNCDRKDGSIIVISKDNQKVEITNIPDALDLTDITKAALTAGADAVKVAAEAGGAKATDPAPADGQSTKT